MNYQTTLKQIESNQLESIYFIWGEELFLIEKLLQSFQTQTMSEEEAIMNIMVYDLEQNTIQQAIQEAETLPFFGDRKVVIAKNAYFLTGQKSKLKLEHQTDALIKYLSHPAIETIFILTAPYNKLDKRKKITKQLLQQPGSVDCSTLSEQQFQQLIANEGKKRGLSFNITLIQQVIRRTGLNLLVVMNELEKLELAVKSGQILSQELIEQLVPRSQEQHVFDLMESLLKRSLPEVLDILERLIEQKEQPLAILGLLITQFRLILQVKYFQGYGLNEPDMNQRLKVHPYRIKLAGQQARLYEQSYLENLLIALIELEYQLKSGQGNALLMLELFFIQFCQKISRS
ncbi:DNA polymerase III subunit delta [Atopobacter phocae]|uniref:DNA polymerase III subunit delta n=1 Tax=Atopobacter phocae TaxID=136492 RepID=UPI0004706C91|nr:DNA polymerase III subunit delta [Atopobacter phocae]